MQIKYKSKKMQAMQLVDNIPLNSLVERFDRANLEKLYNLTFGKEDRSNLSKYYLAKEIKDLLELRKSQNISKGITEVPSVYDGLSLLEMTDTEALRDFFHRADIDKVSRLYDWQFFADIYKYCYKGLQPFSKQDKIHMILDIRLMLGLIKESSYYRPMS